MSLSSGSRSTHRRSIRYADMARPQSRTCVRLRIMAKSTDPPTGPHPDSDGQTQVPDEDQAIRDLAALAPGQLAGEIRADAAEVYTYAHSWRRSATWTGDKYDHTTYDAIAVMKAELDALPEPATHHDVYQYVKAVQPILAKWWDDRPGP